MIRTWIASSLSLELQTPIPRFAEPWCSDSNCGEDLHAKTTGLARSASDRFPSTTSFRWLRSGSKGLGELRVSSIHGLQVHRTPCTSAIQLRALVVQFASIHTDVQRSPEHPGPSNCVTCRRAIQVSGPCDSAWPLSWVD